VLVGAVGGGRHHGTFERDQRQGARPHMVDLGGCSSNGLFV
jgi:hypothetical protein